MDSGLAPAKVNLALHVTGRGADGYHRLDSIVVFAGLGDRIVALPAAELSLAVDGPFAWGVPTGEDNLVMRAARALRAARGVTKGAAMRLTKTLPHAAGIGSGSSDAAATLRLLATFWGVEPLAPSDPEVLALGSDVPACLMAPAPLRMRGRGEIIDPLPPLPPCGLVLVNPGVTLATGAVFEKLAYPTPSPERQGPAASRSDNVRRDDRGLPDGLDATALASAEGFATWIKTLRNDLQAPAEALAPEVGRALTLLRRTPGVLAAVMSGSGATCVGITRDAATARSAARTVQVAAQGWWVAPAAMLGPDVVRPAAAPANGAPQASRATT